MVFLPLLVALGTIVGGFASIVTGTVALADNKLVNDIVKRFLSLGCITEKEVEECKQKLCRSLDNFGKSQDNRQKHHIISEMSRDLKRMLIERLAEKRKKLFNSNYLKGLEKEDIEGFVGFPQILYQIRFWKMGRSPDYILLHGATGCGKETFSKIFALICDLDYKDMHAFEFASGFDKLTDMVKDAKKSVVFFHRIDKLCRGTNETLQQHFNASFISLIRHDIVQKRKLVVVASAESVNDVDKDVRQVFAEEVEFKLPSRDDIYELVLQETNILGCVFDKNLHNGGCDKIANEAFKHNFSVKDVKAVIPREAPSKPISDFILESIKEKVGEDVENDDKSNKGEEKDSSSATARSGVSGSDSLPEPLQHFLRQAVKKEIILQTELMNKEVTFPPPPPDYHQQLDYFSSPTGDVGCKQAAVAPSSPSSFPVAAKDELGGRRKVEMIPLPDRMKRKPTVLMPDVEEIKAGEEKKQKESNLPPITMGDQDVDFNFRANNKGGCKIEGLRCTFLTEMKRTVFLNKIFRKGCYSWVVDISYADKCKESDFWIGAASEDRLDISSGNSLGSAKDTWSWHFWRNGEKSHGSRLSNALGYDGVSEQETCVRDHSRITLAIDSASGMMSFCVDQTPVPRGFCGLPFPLCLGISGQACLPSSFTSVSLRRLASTTPHACARYAASRL